MKALSLLAVLALSLAACSNNDSPSDSAMNRGDLGTGVNTVSRKYPKPASEMWDAAVSATKSFDLTIDSDRHDKMGGEVLAHRASGERVSVKVRSLDQANSEVAVRVEPGNKNMANLIQQKIAEKAGTAPTSKGASSGDYSVDSLYTADLNRCTAAAEAACRRSNLDVTKKEIREQTAVVDAREGTSAPVRIQLDRSGDGLTRVTFIALDFEGSDSKVLASRLKAEFDRQIAVAER